MHDAKIGNVLFQTKGQPHAGEIQDVETERYIITAQRRGELCIHDKMRNEYFIWDLSKSNIQVDAKTGSKFQIDNVRNEAWFYATFEVRGLAERSTNGIMMISPNSLIFMHRDGICSPGSAGY